MCIENRRTHTHTHEHRAMCEDEVTFVRTICVVMCRVDIGSCKCPGDFQNKMSELLITIKANLCKFKHYQGKYIKSVKIRILTVLGLDKSPSHLHLIIFLI